jgi:assimilatory nitrate reductase catalytic subunit
MHWTDAMSAFGSPGRAVNPACDAISGQPELKHTPARVKAFPMRWEGLFLSPRRFRPQGFSHWTRSRVEGGHLYRLAGDEPASEGILLGLSLLSERARPLDYHDKKRGLFRAATLDAKDALTECLLVGMSGGLPDPSWLMDLFARGAPVSENDRRILLGARPAEARTDEGRVVCSCFGVGEVRIRTAIAEGACDTAALGHALKCGTNCGSCLPELRELIASTGAVQSSPEPHLTGV